MGRLNRHGPRGIRTLYVYPHQSEPAPNGGNHHGFPYVREGWKIQYAEWFDWLRTLEGRDLSQADLDEAFQEYMAGRPDDEGRATHSKLIDTERLSVRESGVTVVVLLPEDVHAIEAEVAAGASESHRARRVQECELPIVLQYARRVELWASGRVYPQAARAPCGGARGRGIRPAPGMVSRVNWMVRQQRFRCTQPQPHGRSR